MGAGPEALIPTPISKETVMADEYLDGIHDNSDTLRAVAEHMNRLASAFALTGNKEVSRQLWRMCDDIRAAVKGINDAVSHELNRSVKQAYESSATLVKGVMTGIELGKGENGVGAVDQNEADPLDAD